MIEEARKAPPSGGLLKFYATLSYSVVKKTIQLQASKLATEKLRWQRQEALETATRATAAAAGAAGCRSHAGEKGPGGGGSPAKPGAWFEFDTPAHMPKVRSLLLSFSLSLPLSLLLPRGHDPDRTSTPAEQVFFPFFRFAFSIFSDFSAALHFSCPRFYFAFFLSAISFQFFTSRRSHFKISAP